MHLSGEMPGSRQRRLHRSDKFQLSLRQRETCTSIRETILFPFHGKKKERERERVSSKSAAVSFSRFNPLDCLFITRAALYRDPSPPLCAPSHDGWDTRVRDTCRVVRETSSRFRRFRPEMERIYSLISPMANDVNRWRENKFRVALQFYPNQVSTKEQRERASKTTLAVTKLDSKRIYLLTG